MFGKENNELIPRLIAVLIDFFPLIVIFPLFLSLDICYPFSSTQYIIAVHILY